MWLSSAAALLSLVFHIILSFSSLILMKVLNANARGKDSV